MAALATLAGTALLFGFRDEFLATSLDSDYLVSVVVAIGCLALIGAIGRLKLWSSGFLFAVILVAFHLGVPIVRLFGLPVGWQAAAYMETWFHDTSGVRLSLWLCTAAVLGFTLGYVMLSARRFDSAEPTVADDRRLPTRFAAPGLVLVLVGAVLYMGYAALTAPSLFLGAGKNEYEATIGGSTAVAWGTMLTAVGIIIAVAAPPSKARTWAIRIFVVFALFTLLIGSRTAALYAVVAVVVAVARVRKMPKSRLSVLLILGGLLVISSVQQFRDNGVGDASAGQLVGSPAAGLYEMGSTMRPVVETVAVVKDGETRLRDGETYFVTVIRQAENFLRIPHPTPDPRWADAAIADRAPGLHIGYSAVAEAYLNFGAAGTFVVFAVLGAGFGFWDNRRLGDPVSAARVAVVFIALISTIRATSNLLLVTILLGLLAVELAHRWSRLPSRREKRPAGRIGQKVSSP